MNPDMQLNPCRVTWKWN